MARNASPKAVKRKRQPSRQRDEHARPASALLAVLLSVISAALLATWIAFALPEPVTHTDPHNLVFSETIARTHVSALAEDIGLRLVGSRGEKRAQEYIESALDTIRRDAASGMQFDVDVQVAQGSHRFDFMHEIVMKDYVNVTNVVARRFVEYGAMVGVDMAIYQNSYLYHTMQDTAENVEPGLLQHMGENTLAVVEHLLTKAEIETFKEGRDFVHFDLFDKFFFVISTNTANRIYAILIVVSFLELIRPYLLAATVPTIHQNPIRSVTLYLKTSGFMVCSFLAAIIVPAIVGACTQYVLQKPLLYYRGEWHAFLIFLPASLAGIFACHKFARFLSPPHPLDTPTAVERRIFTATFAVNTLIMLVLTSAGLGSGFIFALNQASHLLALLVDRMLNQPTNKAISSPIHPLAYAVAAFLPAYVAVTFSWNFLMLFVPLAGRMGPDAPVDIIVGVLIGLLAATGGLGWIVGCLSARSVAEVRTSVGTRTKRARGMPDVVNVGAGIGSLACFCAVMVLVLRGNVYDDLHPKRLFIQYLQNVTSISEKIVISHADPTSIAPLAASVSQALGNAPHFLQVYMFDMGKTDEHGGGSGVPGIPGVMDDPLPDLEVEEVWYDEEQSVRTNPSNYFNVTISFKPLPPSDPNRDLVYIHVSAIERDTWDGLEPFSKSRRVFGGGKRGEHAWVWRNGYRSGQVLRRVVEAVEGYTQAGKRGGEWAGWTTEMYMAVDT
ncbi:hypothetical protein HDU81_010505, partial [Chytriomyces hyalinus]